MANNKDRIQALKARRQQIQDALEKGEKIIDAMKGRQDDQARARRATVNATAEKLHKQKEELSARIKEMEDADSGGDAKGLREQLKKVQEQQKARQSVVADQISSLRERIDAAVGENKLLRNLVSKERLSMQIKFNEKVLRLIDNSDQRKELSAKVREQSAEFEKIDKDMADAIKQAGEAHGDSDEARDAERRARELAKDIASKEGELDDLTERLGDADSDEERESIQKKIDATVGEIDALYAKREDGRKASREKEKKDDPKGKEKKDEPRTSEDFDLPDLPGDVDDEAKKLHGELKDLRAEAGKIDAGKNSDQYGVLKVAFKNKRAALLKHLKK